MEPRKPGLSKVVFLLELLVIINVITCNYIFLIIELIADFDLFRSKKLNNKYFLDNAGFLGYKVNISCMTEKVPYSQICGTKVSY